MQRNENISKTIIYVENVTGKPYKDVRGVELMEALKNMPKIDNRIITKTKKY